MATERGFTLIEVLAALLVLALTLGGIMNASAFYARNAVYLNQKTVATWIASNQLEEARLGRNWPDLGRSDGQVEMAGQTWQWQREVEKTPDDRLRRVQVRVRLEAAEEDAWLVSLSAFLANLPDRPQITTPQPQGTSSLDGLMQ